MAARFVNSSVRAVTTRRAGVPDVADQEQVTVMQLGEAFASSCLPVLALVLIRSTAAAHAPSLTQINETVSRSRPLRRPEL